MYYVSVCSHTHSSGFFSYDENLQKAFNTQTQSDVLEERREFTLSMSANTLKCNHSLLCSVPTLSCCFYVWSTTDCQVELSTKKDVLTEKMNWSLQLSFHESLSH